MPARPKELIITTYNVGFGDCFLLSFRYAQFERHVLMDFGSTALPVGAPKNQMMRIAQDIKKRTSGKLHAVVATHRHKDHINGFSTAKNGNATGDVIRSLSPDVVVQPWTEDPGARRRATSATRTHRSGPARLGLYRLAALKEMEASAGAAVATARRMRGELDHVVASELRFIGEDNLANPSAIENLATMMGKHGKRFYVNAGGPSGLEGVLPGVKVHVLGPPTLRQSAAISKERDADPVEFWHFWSYQAKAAVAVDRRVLFPKAVKRAIPPSARWFRRRANEAHAASMLELVRSLDEVMNNTSVILLFEIGKKRLLFPGDAQIEDWSYALSKPKYQKLVAGVNVYKVGHHGSLNATPKKSLWDRFEHRSTTHSKNRLQTLVSTRPGKHGDVESGTEVPRRKLMRALKAETDLFSTDGMGKRAGVAWEVRVQ